MSFRKAVPGDHSQIMQLLENARRAIASLGIDQWQDGYPEPELIEHDIAAGIGYVYDDSGTIASYLVPLCSPEPIYEQLRGHWLTNGDAYLTIHRSAINDGYRGTGLSKKLMTFAEETARKNGLISVRADTHRGNLPMRRLLEHSGYTQIGLVSYDVTAGDPLRVAYEKIL